ncbi:MAG: hypothetical protein VXW87_03960 [Pseudomonadota bacterium]|nr:hypothetical protein [Pseudomonadota bacterium]
MKRSPLFISVLVTSATFAQLSVNLSIGISDISFETKADIIEKYNEIDMYETVQSQKQINPYQQRVVSALGDENAADLVLSQIFVKGSKAGQPWSDKTSDVHMLGYNVTATSTVNTKTQKSIKFEDPIVKAVGTGPDAIAANNHLYITSTVEPNVNQHGIEEPASGKILTLETNNDTSGNGFTFEFSGSEDKVYTTALVSTKRDHKAFPFNATQNSHNWTESDSPASGVANTYAIIISTKQYNNLVDFKDQLVTAQVTPGSSISGEEHFDVIDLGIDAVYDYGPVDIIISANTHYPLPFGQRRSNELIKYTPGATVDASFGALVSYGQGKIGLTAGMAQIRGDYLLSPLTRTYSSFPNSNQQGVIQAGPSQYVVPVEYIDHTKSYTQSASSADTNSRSVKDINEPMYFAEIRAEGSPLYDGGVSLYGKFRVALSEDNSTKLNKLRVTQDSISVGAIFNAFYR